MLHPVVINYLRSKLYLRAKNAFYKIIQMINCKRFSITILGTLFFIVQEDDNKHHLCEKEFLAIVKFQQNSHRFCTFIKPKEQNTSQCTHVKKKNVSMPCNFFYSKS